MAKLTSDKLSKATKQKKSVKDELTKKKPTKVVVEAESKPTKAKPAPAAPAKAPEPKEKKSKDEKPKTKAAPAPPTDTTDKSKKRKKSDSVSEPTPPPSQKTKTKAKAPEPATTAAEEGAPKKKAKKAVASEAPKAEVAKSTKAAEKPTAVVGAPADKKGKKTAGGKKEKKRKEEVEDSEAEEAETDAQKGKGKVPAKDAEPKAAAKAADKKANTKHAEQATPLAKKTKAPAKARTPSPKPSQPAEEEEGSGPDEDAESGDEEDGHLWGFSTDDEDDSSDDEISGELDGLDVSKLPTIAKDDAVVKKKLEKAKKQPAGDLGVIYLGRIPHGFYEDQMRAYFSQFGDVTRLRLSRNKKTGQSKHYAFIEFDSSAVAQIVAETMDNYLLMGHILRCKVIPKDEVHPELWIGANRKWRKVPRDRIARVQHNKPRTKEEQERAETRLLTRQEQRKRKLEEAGIKYDFEAVAYKKKVKPAEA
ncbi:hypothetical protein OBBRIDRAFT_772212 [Obba rivulosa]|uniref:RRM domain-containing protein n=1 Tax=Obba rivulosa TaxID=1052685 RepID=A0A8E2AXN6_9APHY|nr:hypothetical protein OBBRIDRAFT_772212 [Obba rivulosa]